MSEEVIKKLDHPADTNGDGKVSDEEHDMYLDAKRKELKMPMQCVTLKET